MSTQSDCSSHAAQPAVVPDFKVAAPAMISHQSRSKSEAAENNRAELMAKEVWWHATYHQWTMKAALAWFHGPCCGQIVGQENMDRLMEAGFLIAANHVSYLDWLVLSGWCYYRYHETRLVFLAKDSLFRHPAFGPLMVQNHSVRVSNDGTSILDKSNFKRLRRARFVGIFPEGTRSSDGAPGQAHHGAVKLAARLRKPIVPTTLRGFFDSWPRHRMMPRPARCSIIFGSPWNVPEECIHDDALAGRCTDELMRRIGEPLR